MPKVTIIMPSFNVAKYIRPCMESVLAQTLQDIEILAIDAGSTDGTEKILKEYADEDNRVTIVHSEKKSYGYQINMGISLAKGDYVGIVETDDIVAVDMFETLHSVARKTNVEYVKGRAMQFVEIGNGESWNNPIATPLESEELAGKVIGPRNIPELLVRDIYLWTGIYKREFINKIQLNETPGAAFQDQGFLFQTISTAEHAVYIDKIVYYYRQNNTGSSIFNRKGFHYLVGEYSYIEKFLSGKDSGWKLSYYQRMLNQCMGRFRTMAMSGEFWEEACYDIEIMRVKLSEAVKDQILCSEDIGMESWKLLNLFLHGAGDIYSYYEDIFRNKKMSVKRVLESIDENKVIIFGSGRYGKFFHALLESKRSGQAVAFCDNNSELWSTRVQGLKVLSPDEAVREFSNAVYVVANLKNVDIIKDQLRMLGIANEKICVYQEAPDILLFHIREI